jgi:hypothetical protein
LEATDRSRNRLSILAASDTKSLMRVHDTPDGHEEAEATVSQAAKAQHISEMNAAQ